MALENNKNLFLHMLSTHKEQILNFLKDFAFMGFIAVNNCKQSSKLVLLPRNMDPGNVFNVCYYPRLPLFHFLGQFPHPQHFLQNSLSYFIKVYFFNSIKQSYLELSINFFSHLGANFFKTFLLLLT